MQDVQDFKHMNNCFTSKAIFHENPKVHFDTLHLKNREHTNVHKKRRIHKCSHKQNTGVKLLTRTACSLEQKNTQ